MEWASTDTRLATAAVPATPGFHLRRWTVVAAQQCRCTYCPETQLRLLYFMACIVFYYVLVILYFLQNVIHVYFLKHIHPYFQFPTPSGTPNIASNYFMSFRN